MSGADRGSARADGGRLGLRGWLVVAALTALGISGIATLERDYGIPWDDDVQARYGELTLDYFASGFERTRARSFFDTRFYGPVFELGTSLAARALGVPPDDLPGRARLRHTAIALTGLATLLALGLLGLRLGGLGLAGLSVLALATLPRFFGHAFTNSKDVPFACAFSFAVLAELAFLRSNGAWAPTLGVGLATGLAAAVRPGGLPVLLALFAVAGAVHAYGLRTGARAAPIRRLAGRALVGFAIAWIVMVALWPWAHANPLLHPLEAIGTAFAFPRPYYVLFAGEIALSDALPRSYVLHSLAITLPPITGLFALFGSLEAVLRIRSAPRVPDAPALATLLAWLWLPLVALTLGRPNVYDGVRHVLFVLPAVAGLAALGVQGLARRVPRAVPHGPAVAAIAGAIALALPVPALVRLHPYQATYFNAGVGGLGGAAGRYETDYGLLSYREAAAWINAQARGREEPLRVLVAADSFAEACFRSFVAPGVRMRAIFPPDLDARTRAGELPRGIDYYVATTRYGWEASFAAAPVVHEIGREGAVFTTIRGRRAGPAESAGSADPVPRG